MTSYCHYPAWPIPFGLELPIEPEFACPYLPERQSRYRAVSVERVPPAVYQQFMDAGFRRSGHVLYQPVCRGCRRCVPLRVSTANFQANSSQRRAWRRNADLRVEVSEPSVSEEKLALFNRYHTLWHQGSAHTLESLREAFYESCVDTLEFTYRDTQSNLLAVGLCDISATSLSSVYFYFAPEASARALGTYGAVWEIEFARRQNIPYYYLGYWIDACGAMQYKANFGPHELLGLDGLWRAKPTS
ncbi:MAG: arginyltransferase [Bryobacteraceae bacterium]|nr:arginyltransferase [Bryobacteraceae bacterium]